MKKLSQIKKEMQALLNESSGDREEDHGRADELLLEVMDALIEEQITPLRKRQLCKAIKEAYLTIPKWYA